MQRHICYAYSKPRRQRQYLYLERVIFIINNSTKPNSNTNCYLNIFSNSKLWQRPSRLQPGYYIYNNGNSKASRILAGQYKHGMDNCGQLVRQCPNSKHKRGNPFRRYLLPFRYYRHLPVRERYDTKRRIIDG